MIRKGFKLKHSEDFYIKKVFEETTIEEVMTIPVITIDHEAQFHEVADKMREHRLRHLPVVDKDKKILGVISERDMYKLISPKRREDGTSYYDPAELDGFILKQVMTTPVITAGPKDSLKVAIQIFVEGKYGCLPIVDQDKKVLGVLTQFDFLIIADQIIRE